MTSPIKWTAEESGYSLVEVMVAIVVLTVAIVPMVGTFGAAIQATNASGGYDAARTCAVQKLEQAKSLPYETVEDSLPGGVCEHSGFGYTIEAQPIGTDLRDGSGDEGLSRMTVTVSWGGESSYNVAGVVSRW
ncbi:MAG TPA: prepilin-type N-terminal cleavage/methylation domain-containing protein [Rubrobacter sp.]|nr:prepilin-type N-terminal cleavage/methylation domain-containing protein [Rubrobacter sp.]